MPTHFDPSSTPDNCPFCTISSTYPPLPPTQAAKAPSPFDPELLAPNTHLILSTPLILAFLDILPLSPGHLLVTTRAHHVKISDVTIPESLALGYWLPILSRVLAKSEGVWDWNIVQNNGAAAAQVVPHVHYHLIPRPALTPELRNRSFTMFGRGQRSELDDEEAVEMATRLRRVLAEEVERVEKEGSVPSVKL